MMIYPPCFVTFEWWFFPLIMLAGVDDEEEGSTLGHCFAPPKKSFVAYVQRGPPRIRNWVIGTRNMHAFP